MPKASVVIPCFNQGSYLKEAVDSVLAQTFQDFEILVVDDGSTDTETVEILKEYAWPKTRVIRTENQGLSAARNTGIREAQGAYILPLDADDKIGKGYLEDAVRILDRHPEIGIVYCEASYFGVKGGRWDLPEYALDKILNHNMIFCTSLFRKADWEAVGGYNVNMVYGWEDWDFWLSLIHRGLKVYRIPKIHFYYRLREVSMVHSMDEEQSFFMRLHACLNHQDLYRHMADIQIHFRVAELYLDTGLGFNQHQVLRKIIFTDQRAIEFDLSGYTGILRCRFDPINAPASIHLKGIHMVEVDGTSHEIEDFQSNTHCRQDGNLIFITADPQIIFSAKAMERPSRLMVQLTYNVVGPEVYHDILDYQDGLLTETRMELALRTEDLSTREAELSNLKAKHALKAELYLDTGLGFNQHQVLSKIIFATDEQVIEFDLSSYNGIRRYRFDPINVPASIHLRKIRMIEEDGTSHEIEDYQSNTHYRQESTLVFTTADPQIVFTARAMERPSKLIVQLAYNVVGVEAVQDFLGYQEGLLTEIRAELALCKEELSSREVELSKVKAELSARVAELQMKSAALEHTKALLSHREKTIDEIYLSRSWRVTKPMRWIKELLHGGVKKSS